MELLNALSIARAKRLFVEKAAHRTDVRLAPTVEPRIFQTPETFQHAVGAVTIEVFHNGRRLVQSPTTSPSDGDYIVEESTPGGGYDQVQILSFIPNARSVLIGNYFAAS